MAANAQMVTSKVTARSQTTLPKAVRKVLGLKAGSQLGYEIVGTAVQLVNAETLEHEDPELDRFLAFLSRDVASVRPVSLALLQRALHVTEGVPVDHDEPIDVDLGW